MKKPESLREHLLGALPELRRSPERMLVFVDNGNTICTAVDGLSFMYRYSLQLILTDYAGSPDYVMIALLDWLRINESDVLANHETNKEAIGFEAEVLDGGKVDLAITLPLTERVIVRRLDDGSLSIEHPPEPAWDRP